MKSTSKLIAAASVLGVLGLSVLPLATYAAASESTTVEVVVGSECLIGEGTGNESGENLSLSLSVANPSGEDAAATSIDVVCNSAWTLKESAADTSLKLKSAPNTYDGAVGFNAWTSGATVGAFADNTWSMKYTGTGVTATAYHAVPTAATNIATGSATGQTSITQTFGAKTNGSVPGGTYGTIMTYTLAAQ